ncbi:hypothetical protein Ndes2526B_g01147 [Nannochloris sp. 'desiccata']|nr:hypothetical protein NADE_008715 [Chlorella desiccata (nom. nud.)]
MVLPLAVFLIKGLAWIQGIVLFNLGAKELRSLQKGHVTGSHLASPTVLLAYRLAMLLICLGIGLEQLLRRGPIVLAFFTVWNWWLLTVYFALSSAASLRSVNAATRNSRRTTITTRTTTAALESHHLLPADWIEKSAATIFHVIVPISIMIDLTTWFVLIPALMSFPDPEQVLKWQQLMFCFQSYMQHGGNAVMILGDLVLNKIPLMFTWGQAWVALWVSAFGVWSVAFFVITGRFIYPFLDAHKPMAWVGYLALYAANVGMFMAFVGVMKAREAVVKRSLATTTAQKNK